MIIIMIFSLIKKMPVQGVAIPKAKRFIRPFFISRKDQPPYGFITITDYCFPSLSNIKAFTYASLSVNYHLQPLEWL